MFDGCSAFLAEEVPEVRPDGSPLAATNMFVQSKLSASPEQLEPRASELQSGGVPKAASAPAARRGRPPSVASPAGAKGGRGGGGKKSAEVPVTPPLPVVKRPAAAPPSVTPPLPVVKRPAAAPPSRKKSAEVPETPTSAKRPAAAPSSRKRSAVVPATPSPKHTRGTPPGKVAEEADAGVENPGNPEDAKEMDEDFVEADEEKEENDEEADAEKTEASGDDEEEEEKEQGENPSQVGDSEAVEELADVELPAKACFAGQREPKGKLTGKVWRAVRVLYFRHWPTDMRADKHERDLYRDMKRIYEGDEDILKIDDHLQLTAALEHHVVEHIRFYEFRA